MDPKLHASIERIATIYVTYFVMKYGTKIPGFDASIVPDLIVILGSPVSLAYGIWQERKAGILKKAETIPEVKKIELNGNSTEATSLNQATGPKVVIAGETK